MVEASDPSQAASGGQPQEVDNQVPFKDPSRATLEMNMIKVIEKMPEELQARFKALMILYQETENIDEEEEKESRDLEIKYEKMY